MKKRDIFSLVYDLASPVALILAGVVLIISPDTASALISRVLGWCLSAVGFGFGIAALFGRENRVSRAVTAVGLLCVGSFLAARPLLLAAVIGRFIGLLIALRGVREWFLSRQRGNGLVLAVVLCVVGLALMVLPLTASRLVFSGCGVVIAGSGVALLLEKLRHRKLPGGRDDIIDI